MIQIKTKLLRGFYYCYATIEGYDYSFSSKLLENARFSMTKLLVKKGVPLENVKWDEVNNIERSKRYDTNQPNITYSKSRIDNNPFG